CDRPRSGLCAQRDSYLYLFFSVVATPPAQTDTLSLHDALPIYQMYDELLEKEIIPEIERENEEELSVEEMGEVVEKLDNSSSFRSEEHTSELQSRFDLVCRLLLEKKKTSKTRPSTSTDACCRSQ